MPAGDDDFDINSKSIGGYTDPSAIASLEETCSLPEISASCGIASLPLNSIAYNGSIPTRNVNLRARNMMTSPIPRSWVLRGHCPFVSPPLSETRARKSPSEKTARTHSVSRGWGRGSVSSEVTARYTFESPPPSLSRHRKGVVRSQATSCLLCLVSFPLSPLLDHLKHVARRGAGQDVYPPLPGGHAAPFSPADVVRLVERNMQEPGSCNEKVPKHR